MAFFLASFQVHEKSILMAVAPLSVLGAVYNSPSLSHWFAFVATWTLWPLLVLDRLQVAYVGVTLLFAIVLIGIQDVQSTMTTLFHPTDSAKDTGIFTQHWLLGWIPMTSGCIMIGLHVLEALIEPPSTLPDIFPVLWSIVGCGMCLLCWMTSLWELYRPDIPLESTKTKLD
jgi:alpha-1,3-glucosyltransferase